MLVWLAVCSEVQIVCIWSSWCHCITNPPSSLASFKSRLVLPFWYRLIQVVLEKRPLNGCGSISSRSLFMSWTKLNWTTPVHELKLANSSKNNCIGIHVLKTNQALTVLVSLQPIDAKYGRNADARDQWTCRVTGSTCYRSVHFSSCGANTPVFFKSVNIWLTYEQEGGCLVHFVCPATTLIKDEESTRDNQASRL